MILVVVLAAAGLGLTFDRVIIGTDVTSPAESSAGVLGLQPDAASLLIQPVPPVKPSGGPAPSLADRLIIATADHADKASVERDAFSIPPQWRAMDRAPGLAAGTRVIETPESFQRQNRLDAVMVTGDQRCAVVNGQTLYIGQALQGYRLVAVHERTAEFEAGSFRVLLGIRVVGPAS